MDDFTTAYVECALWSSTDESDPETGGDPMDDNYDVSDIAPATLVEMKADCKDFQEANAADLANIDPSQAGHDFWLTRCGHGAGFWDRGNGTLGDRLADAARVYGSVDLYVGDDGRIYA